MTLYRTPKSKLTTCWETLGHADGRVTAEKFWLLLHRDGGWDLLGLFNGMTTEQAQRMAYVRFGQVPEML